MTLDLLTIIKTGIDVAKTLREFKPKPETHDRHLQDDVTRALRTLYFTPTGILSLLKEVAAGKELSDKRIQKALSDFTTIGNGRSRPHYGVSISTPFITSSGSASHRSACLTNCATAKWISAAPFNRKSTSTDRKQPHRTEPRRGD